jgi:hypothetical protein
MTSLKFTVASDTDSVTLGERDRRLSQPRVLPWLQAWGVRARRQAFLMVLVIGTFLRCWQLGALGFNSDEAVYGGQAASIAGQEAYLPYFPIFRAHPLLFQSLLSLPYRFGVADVVGRLLAAGFGVATLVIAYQLGKLLYGRRAGIVAMTLLALMPYHVTVSRQVLLDGPMVFFATAALYALARYCSNRGARWLMAAGALMGLAIRRRLLLLRTQPDRQASPQASHPGISDSRCDRDCLPYHAASGRRHPERRQLPSLAVVSPR